MSRKKPASDLIADPMISETANPFSSATPFDKAYDILSETQGDRLELMTRTDTRVVDACQLGYTLVARFGSPYVSGRVNQLMRLAISKEGEGRKEIVESLKAGAGVPDGYYENGGSMGFGYD